MYCFEPAKQISDLFGFEACPKENGVARGNKLDRCLRQIQGERLSVSYAELRTAVRKARRANRGHETMGFDVRRPTACNVHFM